jgi:hypothetical protein
MTDKPKVRSTLLHPAICEASYVRCFWFVSIYIEVLSVSVFLFSTLFFITNKILNSLLHPVIIKASDIICFWSVKI